MSEQEIPFEESANMLEMEYAVWEEKESTIFPVYRNDEKLIPRQRPRQGTYPFALIPVVIILAFLLFSYVAGFAFYAHSSFGPGYQNGQFYDHDHFDRHPYPQQQFDQPGQPNQPIQPGQQTQPGQPAPIIPPWTTPRISVHHSTG